MLNYFDLRWLLLIPAVPAVGFLVWVFVSFDRERERYRERDAQVDVRRAKRRSRNDGQGA